MSREKQTEGGGEKGEREERRGGERGEGEERGRRDRERTREEEREREGRSHKEPRNTLSTLSGTIHLPPYSPPPPYISPHTSPSPIRPGPCWAGENTASASGKVSLWFRAPGRLTCGGRPGSRQSPMRRSGRCGPTVRREAAEAELGPSERPAGERFHRCRSPAEDGGERRDQE